MHWLLLFALSVGAIALTWLGYPLLLWLRARSALPPEAVGVPAHWPTLSIIVVAHNEAAAITRKLQNVLALDYPADRIEVVLVCDGSTDGTEAAARALADPRLTVLGFVQRRGKAACLNDAVEAARGDVLMFCDVRQRIETSAAALLVARLLQPGVGVVGGELAFEPDAVQGFGHTVDAYWRYEKQVRALESASGSVVGVSGALYVMRRADYTPIPPGTILDDVLIPMRRAMAGDRVLFEAGAIAWDAPVTDVEHESRRKVRTLAGNFQLLALEPRLLNPFANPLFLRLVGHKLLRLSGPLWLALALFAHLMLARYSSFWALMLVPHLGAWALGLLAPALPVLKRLPLAGLVTGFVQMQVCVLRGFVDILRKPAQDIWKTR
jgi:cellulose synthase/poly-beta-1,6-N-acetylglucosamine synthase-like glycosyltransferase